MSKFLGLMGYFLKYKIKKENSDVSRKKENEIRIKLWLQVQIITLLPLML